MNNRLVLLAFAVIVLSGSHLAFGQAAGAAPDDQWHVSLAPYLWFPGVHGTVGTPDHEASVHATAIDVLSNFRFGLMGTADLRYKRLVLPIDIVWVRLGDNKALGSLGFGDTSADVRVSEFIMSPKIGYRLVDRAKFKADALTGFRYWHVGQSLSLNPDRLGRELNASQDWVDPLVGGRITATLSPKVEMTIAGDVGGWGAGSQLDYQLAGLLGYRIKPKIALQVGYRYLSVDYRSSTAIFDTIMPGLVFGVSFDIK